MDHDRIRNAILAVFAGILFAVVCHIAGRVQGRRIGREAGMREGYTAGYADGFVAPHPGDTIYIADTNYHPAPAPATSKPSGTEALLLGTIAELSAQVDSLRAAKPDTAFVEVPVPIEVKTYKGEDYEAQVSGWHPSLDYIKTFPRTIVVTQWAESPAQKRKPRIGFGITAGAAGVWTPEGWKAGPGAAAGVTLEF